MMIQPFFPVWLNHEPQITYFLTLLRNLNVALGGVILRYKSWMFHYMRVNVALHGVNVALHGGECCIVRGERYFMRGECCIAKFYWGWKLHTWGWILHYMGWMLHSIGGGWGWFIMRRVNVALWVMIVNGF